MKIKILPSAISDLRNGRSFYDEQEEGLGDYFQDTIFSDIDSLVLYAGIHSTFFSFYRLLSKRFPYAIYYKIEDDSVVLIYRILDLRSDPDQIEKDLT